MGAEPAWRLVYAQNWEDPELDAAALDVGPDDRVVVIGSGGCTALSLLAEGPRALAVVDVNPAQLATVALKRAAVEVLDADAAVAFLGGAEATPTDRAAAWTRVRVRLDADVRAFWDAHPQALAEGLLGYGRADRFVSWIRRVFHALVVSRASAEALFATASVDEQRAVFAERWDSFRWRGFFRLLDRRWLDVGFAGGAYAHLDDAGWGEGVRRRAERCLTEIPATRSYFATQLFLGRYPRDPEGWPAYLTPRGAARLRRYAHRATLHATDVVTYLRSCGSGTVDKLVLSNVDEWLDEPSRRALFTEAARALRPGGRITCRALVAARPIPAVRGLVVDEARSAELAPRDRAIVNSSFRVLEVVS